MDPIALVGSQLNDGVKLVDALLQKGIPLSAACWLKTSEAGQWYFYLATPLVDDVGPAKAYQRVHEVIHGMPQPFWIGLFDVKLLSPTHPIAVEASKPRRLVPAGAPIRWDSPSVGGKFIECGFIYPRVAPDQQPPTGAVENQPAGQPADH